MEEKEAIGKLRSVELCMSAHPDNEKGSEFEDRIFDLQEMQKHIIELHVKNEYKSKVLKDLRENMKWRIEENEKRKSI